MKLRKVFIVISLDWRRVHCCTTKLAVAAAINLSRSTFLIKFKKLDDTDNIITVNGISWKVFETKLTVGKYKVNNPRNLIPIKPKQENKKWS